MIDIPAAFSGVSVDDAAKAKEFYANTLGLKLKDEDMGLDFELPGGGSLFIYEKSDHRPASYTYLNLVVADIDNTVNALNTAGVKFEIYDNMPAKQDEKGILRGLAAKQGPDIAWFKDPAGNILAVLQDK